MRKSFSQRQKVTTTIKITINHDDHHDDHQHRDGLVLLKCRKLRNKVTAGRDLIARFNLSARQLQNLNTAWYSFDIHSNEVYV